MADMMSKHAFGKKENIETAKQAGKLDEYDVLFLDNGETGWIDKNGKTVISTPRTQKAITVNGASGLGVPDGQTIPAGSSLDEIVKMLVQKAIPATYSAPTVKIANNGGTAAGDVEAGTSITAKLRVTFTKNDAGALTKLSMLLGSAEVGSGTATPYDYTGTAIAIGDETMQFKAQATYQEGNIKADNLGNQSPDGHISAGTIISPIYSISGKRHLFYGTGVGNLPTLNSETVRGLANKKLNPIAGTVFSIPIAVGQQYVIFAYPATLKDVSQIMYVETNDTGCADSFTKTLVDVADARGGANGLKSYKVYSYRMAAPAAAQMTFKVTI